MKSPLHYLLALMLSLLVLPEAYAQIDVRIDAERRQYMAGEPIIMNLYLRNNTDQTVILTNEPGRAWLHLSTSSASYPNGVPRQILAKFPSVTISSGSTAAYKLNIQPAFNFNKNEIYSVTATIRMPDHRTTYGSPKTTFSINEGYSFKKFTILNKGRDIDLHAKTMNVDNSPALFAQAKDKNSNVVLSACYLGKYLSYLKPIYLLDNKQHMHVFFQSSAKYFIYAVVSPDGKKVKHEVYVRTRGPIDLIAVQGKIRVLGAAPYKAPVAPKENHIRSASDRLF